MTHDARVTLAWGEGEATVFRLPFGLAADLEQTYAPLSVYEMLELALRSRLPLRIVRDVLRIGLIGGGATPAEALRLVRIYCEQRPFTESQIPAIKVLEAALLGPTGETAGKASGETAERPAASPSPASTEAAPSWDGPPSRPPTKASGRSRRPSTAGTAATAAAPIAAAPSPPPTITP
jgi:hypothetical protein